MHLGHTLTRGFFGSSDLGKAGVFGDVLTVALMLTQGQPPWLQGNY